MNAVIVPFPRSARAAGERVRAVKAAVEERAKATNAPAAQRSHAVNTALAEYQRTGSASWAIYQGKLLLPQIARHPYREPTPPEAA